LVLITFILLSNAHLTGHRYHICEVTNFQKQIAEDGVYYPPTYKQDGFVHCSSDPRQLIDIGNAFYKKDTGNWVCMSMWVDKLNDVRFEAPAPVGGITRAADTDADASSVGKFPHIYGPITKQSLCTVYNVIRSTDGSFERISGI
jgi:uncharacterized protein (DUF952 family)